MQTLWVHRYYTLFLTETIVKEKKKQIKWKSQCVHYLMLLACERDKFLLVYISEYWKGVHKDVSEVIANEKKER